MEILKKVTKEHLGYGLRGTEWNDYWWVTVIDTNNFGRLGWDS